MNPARAVAFTILGAAAFVAVAHQLSPNTSATRQQSAAKTEGRCTPAYHAEAKAKIEQAFSAGLLADNDTPGGLSVTVREALWQQSDFAWKRNLAEALDCALAGPGKTVADMNFRSSRTNRVVGRWHWGRLTVEE